MTCFQVDHAVMARVCVFEFPCPGVPRNSDKRAVGGGMGCVSRVLILNAGCRTPALWRNKSLSSKPRIWRRSRSSSQGSATEGCSYRLISALNNGSVDYNDIAKYGTGKAAYDVLHDAHVEESTPALGDRTSSDFTCAEASVSSSSDHCDVRSASSNFNNSQPLTSHDNSPKELSSNSEWISFSFGSGRAVHLPSEDYNPTKMTKGPAVESNGSPFDGCQGNEICFMEAEKPAYVSLVWEAGAKIEGVTSYGRQEGIERNEQSLSLVVDEDYHARKDGTILDCFWIWSRHSASRFWSLGQNVVDSIVSFFWSHSQRWKAFWKQALLGAQIPRRLSESKEVWSSLGDATQGTVWLPREDDAFDIFLRNMSEIQKNILHMTAVQGKLAWIRLQQQYYRKLMQLEEILSTFPKSEEELNPREAELLAYTDKLLTQAKMNQEAYIGSQQALITAEEMVFQLQTQVDELKEEVASRDSVLKLLKKEGVLSSQSLQRAAQSLTEAEKKLVELESRVQMGEEIILKERDQLTAALKTAGLHEDALRVSEQKVVELSKEVASLKESLGSERGAEQLSLQVKALENELRSRDRLLLEIKEETIRSTEALKLAAQIKQDLNATRQRELHLTQSLEAANEKVKEFEEKLSQNVRAARAEQVLQHTQKMLTEVKSEVEFLRQGVEARDRAISIMKDEVDMNIALLSNAARDREELREMNRYVAELKMELESREAKLSMMREEMAVIINLAKKQQSTRQRPAGPKNVSPAATSSPPLSSPVHEQPRLRRKTTVRRSVETGTSTTPVRKPNASRRTTRSRPQTP